MKRGRDLDTLGGFDVVRARPQLAGALTRFTGASTIAELTLRFAGDDADPELFDAVADALDTIGAAPADRAREATLAGAWRVLGALGVAPILDECVECHAAIAPDATVIFSHSAGGVLCRPCGQLVARGGRSLPSAARDALRGWLAGDPVALSTDLEARAHQRLLREFLNEHLADGKQLRAFEVWETAAWSGDGAAAAAGGSGAA